MTKGRILMTGFTTQHAGRGTRFKYDPVAKLFADALRHYGYDVEHRAATPGEDLTSYDAVLSGVSPLNALSARFSYGGLSAIARARESGAALVYYADDWQTHLIKSAAATLQRDPSRLVKPLMEKARVDFQWAREHVDEILPGVNMLLDEEWPTLIMAAYNGGDLDKFRPRLPSMKRLLNVDPTPFYTPYDTVIPADEDRERSWVFGVLSDQRKWIDKIDPAWPMAHRGGKASKAEDGGMPETELVQMYADSWGVLSCPYWHAGSGWFRIRHEHAMGTRSVLYTEGELSFISSVFDYSIPQIESLSDFGLRELADAQAEAWYAQKPTKDETAEQIGKILDDEIAAVK